MSVGVEEQKNEVMLSARIPPGLKEDVRGFCLVKGRKVQEFIREAIEEKLQKERRPL